MSYRIHLSMMSKNDYDNYIKLDYDHFSRAMYSTEQIEISDETELTIFTPIHKFVNDEYTPYIINSKNEFKILLNQYKKILYDIFTYNIKEYNELSYKLLKSNDNIEFKLSNFANMYHSYLYNARLFMSKVLDSNDFVCDSSYFFIQYFYLVNIMQTTNFNKIVGVITHG